MKECPLDEWFRKWFDSPYYHLLYRHRDDKEAGYFLQNLISKLAIPESSSILDLACGKGRHSIFLHSQGFEVVGIDLSSESIAAAKLHEEPGLSFEVKDMRDFELGQKFQCVMNLFTSFGYFTDVNDNLKVLANVKNHLAEGGFFVLDYFNASSIKGKLQPFQEVTLGDVQFDIRKEIRNEMIIKHIAIQDREQHFDFEEKVQLLTSQDIERMLHEVGFKTECTFGNYCLHPFDQSTSDRFIIIARN